MNTQPSHCPPARRPERGSAVIVILALLGIILLLVAANTKTVQWVRAEVRLVDQRQTARLAAGTTNPVAGALPAGRPSPTAQPANP